MACDGYLLNVGVGRDHLFHTGAVSDHSARGASPGWPRVMTAAPDNPERPTLLLLARVAVDGVVGGKEALQTLLAGQEPRTLVLDGTSVGWVIPPGWSVADCRDSPPGLELSGRLLAEPWDLVTSNADRLRADLEFSEDARAGTAERDWTDDDPKEDSSPKEDLSKSLRGGGGDASPAPGRAPSGRAPGCTVLGEGPVWIAPGAEVEPGVVIDVRRGGIWIGYGARVEAPSRLSGPARIGPGVRVRSGSRLQGPVAVGGGTELLGGRVGASTIGRGCRIHGEVAHSTIGDFVNKAHDGHLGHAFVGDWVNLGAGTTNSNLKNNYRPVRMAGPREDRQTDLLKMGALIGDYVRTAIGTLIPTGAVIGTGSNIFGGGMAPRYVPAFSWGGGTEDRYEVSSFVESLRRVMARRGKNMTPELESHVRLLWEVSVP